MAKKRSCRRTADEDKIHEKAVKMRKMTDEQLVHYVEDRVEKARSEGFNQGKKSSGGADINKFLKEISSIKGIGDEGGCFDGGRVYFDRNGVDQEGEERANWIDAVWCDGMNRDGLPAAWTYKTDIPCEHFDIWEDGEIYCVGLVFSIEDLK